LVTLLPFSLQFCLLSFFSPSPSDWLCVCVCVLCEGICECVYMCMMGVATAWLPPSMLSNACTQSQHEDMGVV